MVSGGATRPGRPAAAGGDRPLRVVLVDTFVPDRRFSMYLFPRALIAHLPASIQPVLVSPDQGGASRWRRLYDKFFVLPGRIRRAAAGADIVHICDTSHAVFLNFLRLPPTIVTVHDLGATRHVDTAGFVQQKWLRLILRGIARADVLAYVSRQSLEETTQFARPPGGRDVTILNSSYQDFPVLDVPAARALIATALPAIGDGRFILHLGSNEGRKNRATVVRVLHELRARGRDVALVLAGYAADDALAQEIAALGLTDHVHNLPKPDSATVAALYRTADALVFPSTYEGFGVPVVEAQMNGCPVVCSAIPPHLEILAGTGLTAEPHDVPALVAHVESLDDPVHRAAIVAAGLANGAGYWPKRMADEYAALYRAVAR